jgi:hypothetical protein
LAACIVELRAPGRCARLEVDYVCGGGIYAVLLAAQRADYEFYQSKLSSWMLKWKWGHTLIDCDVRRTTQRVRITRCISRCERRRAFRCQLWSEQNVCRPVQIT